MVVRDYASVYAIKDFIINQIAPKYFDLDDVNQFNVGLLGYTTEMTSVTTEDMMNAVNVYMKETFASRSVMPDTIYTNASLYNVTEIAGVPAVLDTVIYVNESDIINKGEKLEDMYKFVFDSHSVIYVNQVPYSIDYDVIITARPYRGDIVFQCQYDMTYPNSISDVKHPYLRSHRIEVNGVKYLAFQLKARQYTRYVSEENIITNDRINFPIMNIRYNDNFAGIDILYKSPTSSTYVPLKKILKGSIPSRDPFFFYSLRDDNGVEISFTDRPKYFQPEYNSDMKIVVYNTLGEQGNFKEYTGNNIQIISENPQYHYMNQIIPFATVHGSSVFGRNMLELEDIRTMVVEKMATSGAYNTEADIQLFLNNFVDINKTFMTFIKKRDDLVERLFAGYVLFKDKIGDYFHTNTLDLELYQEMYDFESDVLNRHVIKAGRVFKYKDGSKTTVKALPPDVRAESYVPDHPDEFVFTNPLLMVYQKNPSSVAYYINSINDLIALDYVKSEIEAPLQFITNSMSIVRDAVGGEDSYLITVTLKATRKLEYDENNILEIDGKLKVGLSFEEESGRESKGCIMDFVSFDDLTQVLTYQFRLNSTDVVTSTGKVTVSDLYDLDNGSYGEQLILSDKVVVNVNILYDYGVQKPHSMDNIEDLDRFVLVNQYATETRKASFIIPVQFTRSQTRYEPLVVGQDDDGNAIMSYYTVFHGVPLLGQHHITDGDDILEFIKDMRNIYEYLLEILELKTNNFTIDMKFYNTYGKSKNFIIKNRYDEDILDRVNINMRFGVSPVVGTDTERLFAEIKEFTKKYVEDINNHKDSNISTLGFNSIYLSNLIQDLENEFAHLHFMTFPEINDYGNTIQYIENQTINPETMTITERRQYVPEYLTIRLEDIVIDLITR